MNIEIIDINNTPGVFRLKHQYMYQVQQFINTVGHDYYKPFTNVSINLSQPVRPDIETRFINCVERQWSKAEMYIDLRLVEKSLWHLMEDIHNSPS